MGMQFGIQRSIASEAFEGRVSVGAESELERRRLDFLPLYFNAFERHDTSPDA